ncbi:MAG: ABC transporter ATP-binding protein [Methanomicrobia archaeon]|nr:ABC transporter ATP-binding protein [Methanomicrobia archaeon]MCK4637227.1 ABC transporter ATP-binding protein [Methanomicrobia archaeon]
MSEMIELIDLKKYYKIGDIIVKALDGVSMKIEEGEFLSVVGPSGSGKTTLLDQIGALDTPTSGKVIIDGIDIAKIPKSILYRLRREKIGFVFQDHNLIASLTALENVLIPLLPEGIDQEKYERALALLDAVGLKERALHKPSEISAGQKQRVATARSLINNPKILLADEPTGSVDTKTGEEIMRILKQLNTNFNTTIIIVTHDLEMARKTERIIFLRDGKIDKETKNL